MDEDELLRRCQGGDDSALGELVRRTQDRIFRLACRVLGDASRAEDAAADALAAVWSRCGSWRGEARAATWIYRVAFRVILNHQRARRRWWRFWELTAAEQAADPAPNPAEVLAEEDSRTLAARRLEDALRQLPPDDRALLHVHYYEQQSLVEVALILGVSRDAVKMRLSRVRKRLREILGDGDELF